MTRCTFGGASVPASRASATLIAIKAAVAGVQYCAFAQAPPTVMKRSIFCTLPLLLIFFVARGQPAPFNLDALPELTVGRVEMQNALWIENPLTAQFKTTNRVIVADLKGPACISMVHFAMPQTLKLNRDLLLKIFWDGEQTPSVDCPLVDFFCDPAGLRDEVNTAFVNKRRGFNAYFPMPFKQSARIELIYDGALEPGDKLWAAMPCYSYVMHRKLDRLAPSAGYFHACWRQEGLLLGKKDYFVMEAKGRGKFVGWNVTVRRPGRSDYPVDENEKFFVDGERTPSIEFQGIEDSFGFSWGYPESQSIFPLTGYFPFFKGGAAYRFFVNDAISFENSLRVFIGFGQNEDKFFAKNYAKRGNELELSSVAYWYQAEPHAPFPPMLPAAQRAPAPEDAFWPGREELPSPADLRARAVRLRFHAGRTNQEVIFAEPGYNAKAKQGFAWQGFPLPVYHCRASETKVQIELEVPKRVRGVVRIYMIDADNFQGGRRQTVTIGGKPLGEVGSFEEGRWLEQSLNADETATGRILIEATNARQGANAVISVIEWIEAASPTE